LWYSTRFVGRETESKPFKGKHEEQIKLVSDLSWYDYGALDGIMPECMEILAKTNEPDEARNERIAQNVAARCEKIERMRERMHVVVAAKESPGVMERLRKAKGDSDGGLAGVPVNPRSPKDGPGLMGAAEVPRKSKEPDR
jgi:hypothetical protein